MNERPPFRLCVSGGRRASPAVPNWSRSIFAVVCFSERNSRDNGLCKSLKVSAHGSLLWPRQFNRVAVPFVSVGPK